MFLDKSDRFEIEKKTIAARRSFFWLPQKYDSNGDVRKLLDHADAADLLIEKQAIEIKGCGDLIVVLMNERGFKIADLGVVASALAAEQKFYALMKKVADLMSEINDQKKIASQKDAQILQLQADAKVLQASVEKLNR